MIMLTNRYAIYPLYICKVIYIKRKKKKGEGVGEGGGGGGGGRRERINNISDNHSYIQILLYCMFII